MVNLLIFVSVVFVSILMILSGIGAILIIILVKLVNKAIKYTVNFFFLLFWKAYRALPISLLLYFPFCHILFLFLFVSYAERVKRFFFLMQQFAAVQVWVRVNTSRYYTHPYISRILKGWMTLENLIFETADLVSVR